MATKKRGVLIVSSEWARHLRKRGWRWFSKRHRALEKRVGRRI